MVWPVKTAGLIEGGLESKKRFRPGDVFSLDFLFYRTGCKGLTALWAEILHNRSGSFVRALSVSCRDMACRSVRCKSASSSSSHVLIWSECCSRVLVSFGRRWS